MVKQVQSFVASDRNHEVISKSSSDLGTLYLVTHGGSDSIVVEAYAATTAGKNARDARYQAYLAGEVEGDLLGPVPVPVEVGAVRGQERHGSGVNAGGPRGQPVVVVEECQRVPIRPGGVEEQ